MSDTSEAQFRAALPTTQHRGDLMCWTGERWEVARHDGRLYPVHDPEHPLPPDAGYMILSDRPVDTL